MSQSEIEYRKQLERMTLSTYRETNSFPAVVFATVVVLGLYLANRYGFLNYEWLARPRRMLLESGWVPYGIIWWCLFGLQYLSQIFFRRLAPLANAATLEQDVIQTARRDGLQSQDTHRILVDRTRDGRRGYFTDRFLRLFNLYQTSFDLAAVQRLRDEILENDEHTHQLGFSAVRCSEWAMPLFGFLGTVIGIGQAIGSLDQGMDFDPAGHLTTKPALIKQSFEGMALAFETTLEGLIGLLLVGTIHAFLRKRLEQQLARAQPYFTETIEKTENRPARVVVEELTVLNLDMGLLRSEMEQLREDLHERHLHHREIEAMVETVIDQDPRFQPIKEILFSPIVEFESAFAGVSTDLEKFIQGKVGKVPWSFLAASAAPVGNWSAALVEYGNQTGLCFFNVLEPGALEWVALGGQRFDRLQMCSESAALLRESQQGMLHRIERTQGIPQSIRRLQQANDLALPYLHDGQALGAVLANLDPTQPSVEYFSLNGVAGTQKAAVPTGGGAAWRHAALAPSGAALVLAEQQPAKGSDCSLLHMPWQPPQASKDKNKPASGPAPLPGQSNRIVLSGIKGLRQTLWISDSELLLLDDTGKVWLFDLSRETPVLLEHERWKPAADTVLIAGHNRWFARHAGGHLSMWKVWRTGRLHDYSSGTPLHVAKFAASHAGTLQEGRLLWSAVGQRLAVWRFPEYQSDSR
ncbi:MAG TPA: MotA/TolQ/ExbB proton channel family protein [Pirellulaceae bacterium]|nr:MotA/TolQ/ExbB proton channel family protein [Pirellulaceae bacterium]